MQQGQKRMFAALPLAVTFGSLTGCGNGNADAPAAATAAMLGAQELRSAAEYLQSEPYANADLENGRQVAAQCRACHTLDPGGVDRIGPNLSGVFGRRAGQHGSFDYSAALRESGFHWTPRALDAWLAAPHTFLPGNRMSFAGITDARDRVDLVAYLLGETSAQ